MAEHRSKNYLFDRVPMLQTAVMAVRGSPPLTFARLFLGLTTALWVSNANAIPPPLEYLFPAGGQQGASVVVSVGGKIDPWPAKVWTDCAGINFAPATNQNSFAVHISKDVPLGPHLVRIYTEDGASEPRCFVVGDREEQLE